MTILVVEDEYLIADDLARELVEHGVTVIGPVATLEAALAAVAEERPDLAVLDINLRGEAVFPLADLLSAQHIPYIFATGYAAAAIPDRFASVMRCEKPIRSGALLNALDRLAERTLRAPLPSGLT